MASTRRPTASGRLGLLVLLVVAGTLTMPRPALACDCPEPPPPQGERERVDAVFAGEVTEVTERNGAPGGPWSHARIEVSEVWKGDVAEREVVRTHAHEATCGYGFEPGRAELIYATTDDDGRWTTNLCDRTASLDQADEDVGALGESRDPRPGSSPAFDDAAGRGLGGWPTAVAAAATTAVAALLAVGVWHRRRRPTA